MTVGLLGLIGFVIFVLAQLYRTLKTFEDLLVDLRKDLPPVLAKLQTTLDGVNSEIDRIEQLAATFEQVSTGIQSTTGAVQRVVASPFIKVAGLASGAGAALSRWLKHEGKED